MIPELPFFGGMAALLGAAAAAGFVRFGPIPLTLWFAGAAVLCAAYALGLWLARL